MTDRRAAERITMPAVDAAVRPIDAAAHDATGRAALRDSVA
jgi:hypothetical protein